MIGVIRHGDRTPKQKMKMIVKHKKFFELFEELGGYKTGQLKIKKPKQLQVCVVGVWVWLGVCVCGCGWVCVWVWLGVCVVGVWGAIYLCALGGTGVYVIMYLHSFVSHPPSLPPSLPPASLLQKVLDIARYLLDNIDKYHESHEIEEKVHKLQQLKSVLEM